MFGAAYSKSGESVKIYIFSGLEPSRVNSRKKVLKMAVAGTAVRRSRSKSRGGKRAEEARETAQATAVAATKSKHPALAASAASRAKARDDKDKDEDEDEDTEVERQTDYSAYPAPPFPEIYFGGCCWGAAFYIGAYRWLWETYGPHMVANGLCFTGDSAGSVVALFMAAGMHPGTYARNVHSMCALYIYLLRRHISLARPH